MNSPIRYNDPTGHCSEFTGGNGGCKDNLKNRYRVNREAILSSSVSVTWDDGTHDSIGTSINSNTVLTHNHYSVPFGALYAKGNVVAYSDPIGPNVREKPETRLFTFESAISQNPAELASQELLSSLGKGDVLQIVYWDDDNEQLSVTSVVAEGSVTNGTLAISIPNKNLNKGDSGGGVFFEGQLVGNLWTAVEYGSSGTIATIPLDYLNKSSKARTRVEPVGPYNGNAEPR